MSEEKESFLRFTLEESVWFQKGQEVTELLNISLDPDITIYENNGYISIDGALELSGEYIRERTEAPEWDFPSSPKFIQTVEHRENNQSEFFHRFPVDITIPQYRVKSLEEIEVIVETFDYSFPERSCLKLTADLMITGLNNEELAAQHQEEALAAERNSTDFQEEIEVTIPQENEEDRVDSGAAQVLENEQAEQTENPSTEEIFTPFTVVARYEEEEEANVQEEDVDTAPILVRNFEPAEQTPEEHTPRQFEPIYVEEHDDDFDDSLDNDFNDDFDDDTDVVEAIEEELEEEKPKKKKKISKNQGISITEFLARKEESEEVARLRVCIVQQGDTIETIADRYDIPILQLIKENQLDVNQDIYEGQVLYIPNTVSNH